MGLKFIPTPRFTHNPNYISNHTYPRLHRDMNIKMYYAGSTKADDENFDSKMYVKNDWMPPDYALSQEMNLRLAAFLRKMKEIFKKKKGRSNLLPHQRIALQQLQQHPELMMVVCDKGLGPAVIERTKYIELAFTDHLNDTNTYQFLTEFDAKMKLGQIRTAI